MTPNNPPEPFRPIQGVWWKSPPFIMLWVGIPMLILLCVAPKIAAYYQCVIIAVGGALLVRYMQTRSFSFKYHYGLQSNVPENLEESLALYNAEIKRRPKQVDAYLRRIVVFTKLGRLEEALGDMNLVMARQPNFSPHYNFRGTIQLDMGQIDGALRDFNMALQLDPNNREAMFNRSTALMVDNQLEEALAQLNFALSHFPEMALLWVNRAQVRLQLDDLAGAEADVRYAFEILNNHWMAKRVRGELYLVRGEITRGVEDLVSAQFLKPDAPAITVRLMVGKLLQGQHSTAKEMYAKLVTQDPQFADSTYALNQTKLHPSLQPVLREFLEAQAQSVTP